MALTGTESALGAALWNSLKATQTYDPPITPEQDALGLEIWTEVAKEIIDHIVANAVVQVASVSGVTPGPGASGPGTGTIT